MGEMSKEVGRALAGCMMQEGGAQKSGRQQAFTLVEVLIALAIIAVALTASLQAGVQGAALADDLIHRQVALWVAQNKLAQLEATGRIPAPGLSEGQEDMAGFTMAWVQESSDAGQSGLVQAVASQSSAGGVRHIAIAVLHEHHTYAELVTYGIGP